MEEFGQINWGETAVKGRSKREIFNPDNEEEILPTSWVPNQLWFRTWHHGWQKKASSK